MLEIIGTAALIIFCVTQFFIYKTLRVMRDGYVSVDDIKQKTVELLHASIANKAQLEALQGHISEQLKVNRETQKDNLKFISDAIDKMTLANESNAEKMRKIIDAKLSDIQNNNEKKLEEMRKTVDEKLHHTLETRLGASFKLVGDRLELLQKGLGEMQSISSQVVDLKNVLSNVKTRGIWGEVQLKSIIEQIMTPDQYRENCPVIPGSQERVEYAIILPGHDNLLEVLLPIDAKFPLEDYQRLNESQKNGDIEKIKEHAKNMRKNVLKQAKLISDKYIKDPYTTDFAIMFLATEGLYSEVLQEPGIIEVLQSQYRVVIAGPSTISAILNSLKMGFKTLAVEKKSKELWALLAPLKLQFNNFATLLGKTRVKLEQASETIAKAENETKKIQNNLHGIENKSQRAFTEVCQDASIVKSVGLDTRSERSIVKST